MNAELIAFERLLKQTDWSYEYAEGKAYWDGQRSFREAFWEYSRLQKIYPEEARILWQQYSRRGM